MTTSNGSAIYDASKGGLYGSPFNSAELPANIRAIMMDFRWATSFDGVTPATLITCAFPASTSDYTSTQNYPDLFALKGFEPLNQAEKSAVTTALNLISSYTNLQFQFGATNLAETASLRFATNSGIGSFGNFPPNDGSYLAADGGTDSGVGGDLFYGQNAQFSNLQYAGTDQFKTIMHEIGHALGLKHGSDSSYNGMLTPDINDNEFSLMTYASYFGAQGLTQAVDGSSPQSYMMLDIAALQAYYGANFGGVGTASTYKWDAVTGQQYLNGMPAANTGVSRTGKIFETVWTQGASTTYDFSNFDTNGAFDLRPGHWSTFSVNQLADLNLQSSPGAPEYRAQGNVYNALLYQNDIRSEVSNIIVGNGDNKITGNEMDNFISLGGGNNIVNGMGGVNTVSLAGAQKDYELVAQDEQHFKLLAMQGNGATDSLENIQQVKFNDVTLVLDLTTSADHAVYLLYQVAFARMPDTAGLRFWARIGDNSGALSVAQSFLNSEEFLNKYQANLSNDQFLAEVYKNAFHRNPDPLGASFWIDQLNKGLGKDQLMLDFAVSNEAVQGVATHVTHGYWTAWDVIS